MTTVAAVDAAVSASRLDDATSVLATALLVQEGHVTLAMRIQGYVRDNAAAHDHLGILLANLPSSDCPLGTPGKGSPELEALIADAEAGIKVVEARWPALAAEVQVVQDAILDRTPGARHADTAMV